MPSQADIDQQLLLAAHRRTLHTLLAQRATHTRANEPPAVNAGILDARAEIARIKAYLRTQGITVDDLPEEIERHHEGLALLHSWSPLTMLGAAALIIVIVALMLRLLPSITIWGNGNITNTGPGSITINQGDPPAVRQQKLEQAKRLIISDVLDNVSSLDARLRYTSVVLDPVADPLRVARQTVAPLGGTPLANYQQLIATQQIASLQASWNSQPLRATVDAPLVQVLLDSNQDPEPVRFFYRQITAVQDASDSLIVALTDAEKHAGDPANRQYWLDTINLAHATFTNRTSMAYAAALDLIAVFDAGTPANSRLAQLQQLVPRQAVTHAEAIQLLSQAAAEIQVLSQRRAGLSATAVALRSADVATYVAINSEIVVKPDDPADTVAKKASALRTLGRIQEALAAYTRYGELAASDPTTAQYVRVGQSLAQRDGDLARIGGVYIFAVEAGGPSEKAGLAIGDVVITYNSATVATAEELKAAIKSVPSTSSVTIEWLRLNAESQWVRGSAQVPGAYLGAGLATI